MDVVDAPDVTVPDVTVPDVTVPDVAAPGAVPLGTVLGPDAGVDLGAIGLGIRVRLTGADTHDAYSLFEYVVPAGRGGPPTHIHSLQDELFTCVTGKVVVELDREEHTLSPGDSLLMPRGVPHMFHNPFDAETRIVAVVSPAGLEKYYAELSQLPPGPRDMTAVAAIMARHGLSLAPKE